MQLDAGGAPILVKHYGPKASLISAGSVAAVGDGQIVIAGEFIGEPTNATGPTPCETSREMPGPEPMLFPESSAVRACECVESRRNLYALWLNRDLEVVWSRTLTQGFPNPLISANPQGGIYWSNTFSPGVGYPANRTLVAEIGPPGQLAPGWSLDGPSLHLAAASDGALYLADRRVLKRVTDRSPQK